MPDTTIRKRALPNKLSGTSTLTIDGTVYWKETGELNLSGTQRTVSEGHQVSQLGNTDLDIGGDFHTFKSEVVHISCRKASVARGFDKYVGPLVPAGARTLGEHEVPLRSIHELNALGATAISRCSPVDSCAEALTSVSETLKDGLPAFAGVSTWRDRTHVSRGAGSEYLNAQFGWLPLLSDVRAVADSYKRSAKILNQLKRDSGRNVRRTYDFPIERESETITNITENGGVHLVGAAPLKSGFWDPSHSGSRVTTRETTRKTWFSGAFTYYIPDDDTKFGRIASAYQMADHLYGVGLTPDVLWNLTPWSWATDWFANTGDVMSNVSNAMMYGQILRYGYLMEKTTIIDRHTVTANDFIGGRGPYEVVVKTTVKRRIRANPFGFGITFDGLDGYQLSILAALGITRR